MMKFNANQYLEVSANRIEVARRLHRSSHYSAAIYFAGVSVECLLRAYITRVSSEFHQRHDLRELFKKSQIQDFLLHKDRRLANAWLGDIWARWKNNYRYASDDRLRSEFRKLGLHQGIKGDYLKKNSNDIIEAALNLRQLGVKRWASKMN